MKKNNLLETVLYKNDKLCGTQYYNSSIQPIKYYELENVRREFLIEGVFLDYFEKNNNPYTHILERHIHTIKSFLKDYPIKFLKAHRVSYEDIKIDLVTVKALKDIKFNNITIHKNKTFFLDVNYTKFFHLIDNDDIETYNFLTGSIFYHKHKKKPIVLNIIASSVNAVDILFKITTPKVLDMKYVLEYIYEEDLAEKEKLKKVSSFKNCYLCPARLKDDCKSVIRYPKIK